MTWWGWTLWIILMGTVLHKMYGMTIAARAASLRRRLTSHKRDRESLSIARTERQIRQTDHELWPEREHHHVNCTVCGPGPLLRGVVPSKYEHPFFKDGTKVVSDSYGSWTEKTLVPCMAEYAETVSSRIIENGQFTGLHTIMLDLDMPVTVVESSTPGHHHLYIDYPLHWSHYKALLRAMQQCGMIEGQYYNMSIAKGATVLRPPWVKKPMPSKRKLRKGGIVLGGVKWMKYNTSRRKP